MSNLDMALGALLKVSGKQMAGTNRQLQVLTKIDLLKFHLQQTKSDYFFRNVIKLRH